MKTTKFVKAVVGIGALLLALMVAPATMAYAATSVNVPCAGPGGGAAGLIAAINASNGSGGGKINLAPGCTYVLTVPNNSGPMTGANGLPAVTSQIVVNGNAATITRNPESPTPFRIFEVDGPGGNLTLTNLSVTGGVGPFGGGIFNDEGMVTLNNCEVAGNTGAMGGGGIASGIGPDHPTDIGPIGTFTLNKSQVTSNSAPGGGGGGVLNHAGTLILNDSQVNGNSSLNGGGIASGTGNGGTAGSSMLILNRTEVNDNSASVGGDDPAAGGIANGGTAVINSSEVNDNLAPDGLGSGILNHGTMTINRSQVNDNSAPDGGDGGGIVNYNVNSDPPMPPIAPNSGMLRINSSQVDGNSAADGAGGGILNDFPGQEPATLVLDHTFVDANVAAEGGGIYNIFGPVTLGSSSVSGNTPDNCEPLGSIPGCID
ncbi:MAG: hypothetical protein WB801_01600 [Candidatus Dormiibacterota bacterium]